MTETQTTPDGVVWFRNPFQDRIGNKWIDAEGFITLLKTGTGPSFKELPKDVQDAVMHAMQEKKNRASL